MDYTDNKYITIYHEKNFDRIPQLKKFDKEILNQIKVVSQVLPFRVNNYVIEELIDWDNIPDDPLYQLTFPQKKMLSEDHFNTIQSLLAKSAGKEEIQFVANNIRQQLNPHPSGQMQLNVPLKNGIVIPGIQHKYRETILFFPAQGQTCHTYCTFCFRWAQFVGDKQLRFASNNAQVLFDYVKSHPDLTDVIFTGGDPFVMKAHILANYLDTLLHPNAEHIQNIRIGTKALTYWPQRFLTDEDADHLLNTLERLVKAGKHLAIMAHYNHWRELETSITQKAIARLQQTGAVIRSQGPVLSHINDDPEIWATLWKNQVKLGIIPYYMFVERDTGPKNYFEVPLEKTWQIYQKAIQQVSGLARSAKGPSMSAHSGKIEISGLTEINAEKVFVLKFLQARKEDLVNRPFFAKYSAHATWFDQLVPAFDQDKHFFD